MRLCASESRWPNDGAGDEHALDELHARYGHLHWVHVLNNAALIAYALAASDGELGPAIAMAVSGGWDTDSAGATVGAICGASVRRRETAAVVDRSIGRTVPDDAARLRRRHRGGADGSDLCGGIVTATPVESTSAGGVVVVGSANADLVLRLAELPGPGETLLATETSRLPGGKGANQAVAAARAGASTTLIAAIGDDADGRLVRDALVAAGVDVRLVRTSSAPTGLAVVLLDDRGQNSIVVAPGANATIERLRPDERDVVRDGGRAAVPAGGAACRSSSRRRRSLGRRAASLSSTPRRPERSRTRSSTPLTYLS